MFGEGWRQFIFLGTQSDTWGIIVQAGDYCFQATFLQVTGSTHIGHRIF